jgi:hypothetical protein
VKRHEERRATKSNEEQRREVKSNEERRATKSNEEQRRAVKSSEEQRRRRVRQIAETRRDRRF